MTARHLARIVQGLEDIYYRLALSLPDAADNVQVNRLRWARHEIGREIRRIEDEIRTISSTVFFQASEGPREVVLPPIVKSIDALLQQVWLVSTLEELIIVARQLALAGWDLAPSRNAFGPRRFKRLALGPLPSASAPAPRPRWIQARVVGLRKRDRRPRSEAPLRALRAGGLHAIEVRVGEPDGRWSDEREWFPRSRSPRNRSSHLLTVVFTEPRLAPVPQVERIILPAYRGSDIARFRLKVRDGVDQIRARITVLYENRVLQTAALHARVIPDPALAPPDFAIEIEPETFTSLDLDDLDSRPPFDLALILNHTDDHAQATAIAGDHACLVNLGNVDTWAANISDRLSEVAYSDEDYATLDAPRVSELFHFLAVHGSLFFEAIFDGATKPLRDALLAAHRVQLVAARQGGLLPLEMAYVHRAPKQNAPLCPHAAQALMARACSAVCPLGEQRDQVVCPLGFWGLSRVIERQSDGALPLGADFGIRLNASPRRRIDLLDNALFAASRKADEHAGGSSAGVRDALASAAERMTTATTWDEWVARIKAQAPSLLVLLVHTEQIKKDRIQALEIGDGDLLPLSNIYQEHIRANESMTPVVLLIGCRTAISHIEFQQFPVKFMRYGAALVLGTIATVLGRRAGPVTARLVETLAEMTEKGDVAFGDALLAAKQKLVGEGQVMAVCLCAHGDAGWVLGKARQGAKATR